MIVVTSMHSYASEERQSVLEDADSSWEESLARR